MQDRKVYEYALIRVVPRVERGECMNDPSGGPISQLDQAGRFRWLTATRSTILQCSEVHPGLCTDPEAVLDDLFERYIL